NRKITFLCGHDNTLQSLLAALDVKDYKLPNTIDAGIPIGAKVVFNKFVKDSQEYCDINLVYLTVDQIRHGIALDLSSPAMAFPLEFDGIERNSEGLFKMSDVESMLKETIAEYDK
ncbi:MAG: glucose-1-phosphatase, partial [bacterium]|nr:glucose-1-phosphatase [bacterium]